MSVRMSIYMSALAIIVNNSYFVIVVYFLSIEEGKSGMLLEILDACLISF